MGKMGRFSFEGLEDLQRELKELDRETDAFLQSCAKELAARLLRMVVKRTPVGEYGKSYVTDTDGSHVRYKAGKNKGKVKRVTVKKGGTLRRGWTAGGSAKGYGDLLAVHHFGDTYAIEIVNPVEYASYVEYGHRTANHKGWVKGHFMMTISEQELQSIVPQILERRIREFLGGVAK
nr:HK97 gp10 family phage protein [uncultured Acetatifactor sp.]